MKTKKAEAPGARPSGRSTPRSQGAPTYIRETPKNANLEGFWASGKGSLEIEGDAAVRVAGQGTLWLDPTSTVSQDAATTFSLAFEPDARKLDRFSGTLLIFGSKLKVRFEGDRILVTANGSGKATMKGTGLFRMTSPKDELVSGLWSPDGVAQEFKSLRTAAKPTATPTVRKYGSGGMLPVGPPADARAPETPTLPSEVGKPAPTPTKFTRTPIYSRRTPGGVPPPAGVEPPAASTAPVAPPPASPPTTAPGASTLPPATISTVTATATTATASSSATPTTATR
jgi:hypothetical protein